jgi:hypothetical protein
LAKSFLELNKWDIVCSAASRKEREVEVYMVKYRSERLKGEMIYKVDGKKEGIN